MPREELESSMAYVDPAHVAAQLETFKLRKFHERDRDRLAHRAAHMVPALIVRLPSARARP